jgi:hypothetical protein
MVKKAAVDIPPMMIISIFVAILFLLILYQVISSMGGSIV